MKISTRPKLCIGSGNCVDIAPLHFDQSETDGTVELLVEEVGSVALGTVAEAVAACPVGALVLVGDGPDDASPVRSL